MITVKGPKGTMNFAHHPLVMVELNEGQVVVTRPNDEKEARSLHGLTRSLIANMITGVTQGFKKALEIRGVGYRAAMKGKDLDMSLGYSHPVIVKAPEGITFELDPELKNVINVMGISKEVVGQTAAHIRSLRPPEPYKGKGVRYLGEEVRRKAGKTSAS